MSTIDQRPVWAKGDLYEPYVGRWSRLVARTFLRWLDCPARLAWLDVGCGTGAVTAAILASCAPHTVIGVEPAEGFVAYARAHVIDPRAGFRVGDAQTLPASDGEFDVAVSGLVLNFVPNHALAAAEMKRAVRPGGVVAAYVWDYAGEMQLMRYFWDAAIALDPAAADADEGRRFPLCKPQPLTRLFEEAGVREVETRAIDAPTMFKDFDDYWSPFLGGQAPAPGYCMSLSEDRRAALRELLRSRLPIQPDGTIALVARAWAVKGMRE